MSRAAWLSASCCLARASEPRGGTLSAAPSGPSMKPSAIQSGWIVWMRQPVSSSSASQLRTDEHVLTSYSLSLSVACAASCRATDVVASILSPYRRYPRAKRHAVRAASDPNSAAGVPDPLQLVARVSGEYQLGTSPVASHCVSATSRSLVSISASHSLLSSSNSIGSIAGAHGASAYAAMKSRKAA